jgi:hypothetical protein
MNYLVSLTVDKNQLQKSQIQIQSNLTLDVLYVFVNDVECAADVIEILYEWLEEDSCILSSIPELPFSITMDIIPSEEDREKLMDKLEPIIAILNESDSDTPHLDNIVKLL